MTTRASCAVCAQRRKHERSSRLGGSSCVLNTGRARLEFFLGWTQRTGLSRVLDVLMVLSFFFSAYAPTAWRAQCALVPATCSVVGPHVAVFGMREPDSGPVRRI